MHRHPSATPGSAHATQDIRVHVALAAAIALLLGACTGSIDAGGNYEGKPEPTVVSSALGTLTVTNPLQGALLGSRAVTVEGVVEVAGITEVTLNGAVAAPVDEHGLFKGTVLVDEGPTSVSVSVKDLNAAINFEVDSRPPVVVLESPAPASFVEGTDIRFRGTVQDEHPKSLRIGDTTVQVAGDGTFDTVIPVKEGAHHIRVEAADELGHATYTFSSFLAGSFVSTYAMQPGSVVVKLGERSIDTITDAIQPYMTPATISGLMTKANPVKEDWWGRVDFLGEHHDFATVVITPQNGYIDVTVVILNARIPYRLDHFLPGVITGDATASYIEARGRLSATVENGRPYAWVSALDITMLDFFVDMAGWPDVIDRVLVSGIARQHVIDSLRGHVAVKVPEAVDLALAKLPMSGDVTVMGHTGTISGKPSLIGVSAKGLRAVLDMNVRAKTRDWDLTENAPGPIYFGRGPVPTSGTNPDIEAAISLDLLNSVSYAAWSTGGLAHRLEQVFLKKGDETPLDVQALSLLVPGVDKLADPDTPVAVEVAAMLPAVLEPKEGALVEVVVPDLRVRFFGRGAGDNGEDVRLFELSIGARAPVKLQIVNDIVNVSIPEYDFDAHTFGEAPPGTPSGDELDNLILDLVEPYIEQYSEITGLRIPSVMGYRITATSAALSGGYFRANGRLYRE